MNGYWAAIATVVAWGLEYAALKRATERVGPLLVGLVVYGLSAVALACIDRFMTRPRWRSPSAGLTKKTFAPVLLIGAIAVGINVLWLWGAKLTSVANAAALGRADVLFTLMLTPLVPGERIRRSSLLFAPFILFGIALCLGVRPGQLRIANSGDVMILASTALLCVNAFIIKKTMRHIGGTALAMWNCLINAIFFAGASFWGESNPAQLLALPLQVWIVLLLSGLFCTSFFVFYYQSLRLLPVWEVRLLCLGVPAVASLASWLASGPAPAPREIAGTIAICLGAAGVILTGRRFESASRAIENLAPELTEE